MSVQEIADDAETREMQAHLQVKLEEEEEHLPSCSEVVAPGPAARVPLAPAYCFPRDVHYAWTKRVHLFRGAGESWLLCSRDRH